MTKIEKEAPEFSRQAKHYKILDTIGVSKGAVMYKTKHLGDGPRKNHCVAIKIVNIYKVGDIYMLTNHVHESETCDHENLVKVHCSFKINNQLWIIMPVLTSGPSLRAMMLASTFRAGLPEPGIMFVLKGILKGLNYMHARGKVHGDIGADCVFLDKSYGVKLALRSLAHDKRGPCGYPDFMIAPELIEHQKMVPNKAVDIWMFGLLALELFYGKIPASNWHELKSVVMRIRANESSGNETPRKKQEKKKAGQKIMEELRCFRAPQEKQISDLLTAIITSCLVEASEKRPTASELMELFDNESSNSARRGQGVLRKLRMTHLKN